MSAEILNREGIASVQAVGSSSLSAQTELDTTQIFSHVLVIEDDPGHAKLLMRHLRGLVGDVIHAIDGKSALKALEENFFELILCDLHLPDMSGLELLNTIRSVRPGLPIVVQTSSNNLDDAITAMRQGAWDYTVKDFTGDFQERLRLILYRAAERKMREHQEIQLRAERDAFWAAVHTAQDGVAILGAKGNVVFANERFDDFLATLAGGISKIPPAYNLVELIGMHDNSVAEALGKQVEAEDKERHWKAELKISGDEETPVKRPDRYYELTLSSVKLSRVEGTRSVIHSLQEIRRAVIWVKDITGKKEQEKFQRDLLSTTTHDLKGPLGAILTSAELLEDKRIKDESMAKELVTRIASCARNSITIIDELLSARRIQDGVLVVKPRWYPVNDILEDTVLDYLPIAKAKAITLVTQPVSPDLQVFADKIGITRVLGNLVSNAVKFTPKGGKVELSAERIGNEVRISVSDSGNGIDPKVRHYLFQRYSRLDEHQEIEGTGLGLFVCKNIVSAHNGRIEVQSEVKKGSTFIVCFPDEIQLS